jgi:hypothetical protein
MSKLAKAIISVMKAVKGIEKNSTVGEGNYAYKGVNDKDVKEVYSKAMADNGLCILPLEVDDEIKVSSWVDKYDKRKQQVFCSVKTKYLLLHESGENQILSGYGHGVDSQDKAAGKATTYALKYALLYTFMTPTGKIDDTDNTHSEEIEVKDNRKTVNKEQVQIIIDWAKEKGYTIANVEQVYKLTATQKTTILKAIKK